MSAHEENFAKLVEVFKRHVGKKLFAVTVLASKPTKEKTIRLEFQSKDDIGDIQTVYLNVSFDDSGNEVRWIWDSGKDRTE